MDALIIVIVWVKGKQLTTCLISFVALDSGSFWICYNEHGAFRLR